MEGIDWMTRETDLAWAAGFVDGEGCFSVQRNSTGVLRFRFTITQVDRRPLDRLDVILRLDGFLGKGKVRGPRNYLSRRNAKPYYLIGVTGRYGLHVYELLEPYLSEPKKEQVARVLDKLQTDRQKIVDEQRRF